MKLWIIIIVIAIIVSSLILAQEANQEPQQSRANAGIQTLNNGQYTITYNPRDLAGIIKAEKKQSAGQTQAMLRIYSSAENSDYGLLKSGNIKKMIIENLRGERTSILEVSNNTVGAIFENDFVKVNGTFKIRKGSRRKITTNEGTRPVQTAYFELEREANLELSPTENEKLLIECVQDNEQCKRIIGFGDAEGLTTTANWLNIRGEANLKMKPGEQNTRQPENQEAAELKVRNIAGILPITGERESVGRAIMLYGIPYLDRNPGSLFGWNRVKSEMPVILLQTYGTNGQVLKSGIESPTFDRINVYDTCATPNCWFTTFMSENGGSVAFFSGNLAIMQLLDGKMAYVKQENLYSGCLLERGVTCVRSDETGSNIKISLTGNSKIKIEPPASIRKLNFERIIDDNSEVVVEDGNRRLVFNKDGVKYTGPDAWYSLKTSFSIPEIIGGKRRLLECNAGTRKCLVDGKETLSPELKSCTSNDECGPEELCADNICIKDSQTCVLFRGNEKESNTRSDILVIVLDVPKEDIDIDIGINLLESGTIFRTAPFSTMENSFNIWKLNEVGESQQFSGAQVNSIINTLTGYAHRACPIAEYLLVIGDDIGDSYSTGRSSFVSRFGQESVGNCGETCQIKRTVTHELGGHAIGGLSDEYTKDESVNIIGYRGMGDVGPTCARTEEEAIAKFGTNFHRDWIGCGGNCDWNRYHCDEWFTVEPTAEAPDNPKLIGTQTIMGDQARFSEFSGMGKRIIQGKISRSLI